jgi:hypothetical protein
MVQGSDAVRKCGLCFIAIAALIAYGASAAEKKATPELDPKVCQQMVSYQPEAGKGADYKPGVDVHGKPVVEADVTPNVIKLPDTISFNVTVDLARYLGLAAPTGLEGEAVMGKIEVDKTGHATFNGQPLEGNAEAALRELCAPKPAAADKDNHNQ